MYKENDLRKELMSAIENIWMEIDKGGDLKFDLELILYPFANSKLSETNSKEIMLKLKCSHS